jgi:hypothetical protein
MYCPRRTSVVLLAGALVLGCGEQPSPAEPASAGIPSPSVDGPSFGAARLPAFNVVLLGGVPSNPLAVQAGFSAGATAEDVCNGAGAETAGQKGQDVFTPAGGFQEHVRAIDVSIVVYEFSAGPVTGPCQLVGAPVVGTGTGEFTEVSHFQSSGSLVIHWTIHGTIDLVSGGQARLLAKAQVVVRPDGTLVLDDEPVSLTPL